MDEYIKREAVFMKLMQDGCSAKNLQSISDIPGADFAPVVHGHRVDDGGFYARCSQCNGVLPLCANYCPNCGAKMDEQEG
nr:MAG TPA: PROTEIN/RNA Complex, archaeal, ribosomal, 50S, protein.0A [Caudoviricetes sp.]